jgi:type I restriction enzyme S subunit
LRHYDTSLYVTDFKGNDRRFIYYFLQSQGLERQNVAGAVPGVNRNYLHQLPVRVPPLSTQRKITAILSAYDDLIENNTRRIQILEEMAQAIYRQWFVEYKFPGHEGVPLADSGTELGEIPEGWDIVSVSDLYDTSAGGTPSRKVQGYFGGDIKWIKTRELNDRHILDTEEKITETGLKKSSAKLFPTNAVIMAMYGATIGKLGILTSPMATNQACCALLSKRDPFSHAFIFLTMLINRERLLGLGMGAAQQNISQAVIRGFELLKPDDEVVQEFNRIAEPILEEIRVLQQKNANLRATRDLLLPRLVSGELDVSQLEIQ